MILQQIVGEAYITFVMNLIRTVHKNVSMDKSVGRLTSV